jgi:NADH-quinone oxidoreductase subunit J
MNILFYIAAAVAIIATLKVVIGKNAVHSLLYLIVSLLAVSLIFFLLGAPFVAALEVIIYAGAVMVLFVFVIMMMNARAGGIPKEYEILKPRYWIGPSIISMILFLEMIYMLTQQPAHTMITQDVFPQAVGKLLLTKYILVVQQAAFLLTAGIVGAYHIGEKKKKVYHRYLRDKKDAI